MPSRSKNNNNHQQRSSSSSRGGATLSQSPGKYLRSLDKRALDLEKQLDDVEAVAAGAAGAVAGSKTSGAAAQRELHYEQANALRVPLCETLSDMILFDPDYAVRNHATDRLWRRCFYQRIGRLRQRIARERKRNKTSAAAQQLERYFVSFLAEAVTLYDYLCGRLTTQLAKAKGMGNTNNNNNNNNTIGGSADDTASSFGTVSASSSVDTPTSTKGYVECLFRLYVCSGDLYRYSHNSNRAQACYLTSANLGPGHGHPYNQLGVTCQTPATTSTTEGSAEVPVALTLYWYARAMLATDQPSVALTKANVGRLVKTNRDWIREQHLQMDANGSSSKSMMTRRVLSLLVDLHAHFVAGLPNDDASATAALEEQIETVVTAFTQLVNQSALGDSLLCKLVALQAFSEFAAADQSGEDVVPKDDEDAQCSVRVRTWRVSRRTTYLLAAALADRVVVGLKKLTDGNNGSSSQSSSSKVKVLPPSVRLLLPLLLVSEYLYHNQAAPYGVIVDDSELEQAQSSFGSKLVQVLNLLSQLVSLIDGSGSKDTSQSSHSVFADLLDDEDALDQLKEYRSLRGYVPFASFVSNKDLRDGYVPDEEALTVLSLHNSTGSGGGSSSTQESSATAMTGFGTAASQGSHQNQIDQGRIKVARFLRLGDQLAADTDSALGFCIQRGPDGRYSWTSHESDDDDGHVAMQVDDDEDEAGDHVSSQPPAAVQQEHKSIGLLYKRDNIGGPALLVPSALLQQQQQQQQQQPAVANDMDLGSGTSSPLIPPIVPVEAVNLTATNAALDDSQPNSMLLQNLGVTALQQPASLPTEPLKTAEQHSPVPAAPPGAAVLPPPGFGSPAAPVAPSAVGGAPLGPAFDGGPVAGLSSTILPGFHAPNVSMMNNAAVAPPHMNHQYHQQQQQPRTLLESFHLLEGGLPTMPTANPFATYSLPPQGTNNSSNNNNNANYNNNALGYIGSGFGANTAREEDVSFLEPDGMQTDGAASLLGSGLLSSLLSDDSPQKTKNPFAT